MPETIRPSSEPIFVVMYAGKHGKGPETAHRTEAGARAVLRERIEEAWGQELSAGADLPEVIPSDLDEACELLEAVDGPYYWIERLDLDD